MAKNTLMSLADAGTTGNLTVTGNLLINSTLGVGTASPQAPAHVVYQYGKTDTGERGGIEVSSNDASARWGLKINSIGAAAVANRVFKFQTHEAGVANNGIVALQPDGGQVVIGGVTPTSGYALTVTGNIYTSGVALINGGGRINTALGLAKDPGHLLDLNADDAFKPTTNLWGVLSDRRIKTDVRSYIKGMEAIRGIRPVEYHYNGKGGFTAEGIDDSYHVGIIAQELQAICPEMVEMTDSGFLGYQGHNLQFMVVNALKELDARLTAAEKRN